MRIPPPVLFAAPFVAAALLHRRRPWPVGPDGHRSSGGRTRGDRTRRGRPRRYLGITLIGAGAGLMGWSLARLRAHRTTVLPWAHAEHLVRDGPFARLRNPIYAGDLLVYLGGALLLRSAWPLVPLPAVLQVLRRYVIEPEETYLTERFGTAYTEYCREVPRLVPRPGPAAEFGCA